MPGNKDLILPKALRTRRVSILYLICILFLSLLSSDVSQDSAEDSESFKQELDVLEFDVLDVSIRPAVLSLWARSDTLYRANPCVLYTSLNEDGISIVRMQPQSEGVYNLTIVFWSNETWQYTIGVFTGSPDFYRPHGNVQRVRAALAESFVEFLTLIFPPGNYTISIRVNCYGTASSSSFFIRLPTPVNSMLLITAAGLIAYLNVFLIFDTYFKSKKEIVSGRRWMLCSAAAIISIVVIYQLYSFATFTL